MIEMLKKTLLAGVGATVVTAEKVEAALSDLVDRGRLSADEAKETASKIANESKKEFEEARSSLSDLFEEWLERANVAAKRDVDALEARVAVLEAKHAAEDDEADKASAKKK
jgi:polyhydroxyalkanoate synthesis regulator phasin